MFPFGLGRLLPKLTPTVWGLGAGGSWGTPNCHSVDIFSVSLFRRLRESPLNLTPPSGDKPPEVAVQLLGACRFPLWFRSVVSETHTHSAGLGCRGQLGHSYVSGVVIFSVFLFLRLRESPLTLTPPCGDKPPEVAVELLGA